MGIVMFGRQRDQPGVLLEPSPGNQIDVNDQAQVSDFRNKIWYAEFVISVSVLLALT